MADINFVELATYCQKVFREEHTKQGERYIETLFVSISEDNSLKYSTTPHVLSNAHQCILVHQWSELAVRWWYSWYKVEFIDTDGRVRKDCLDDNFKLRVSAWGSYSSQIMQLSYANQGLYWFGSPFERNIPKVWELYSKVKDIKNEAEIKLIAELYRKDDQLFELEKENENFKFSNILLEQEKKQYQKLLDDIKEMCDKLKETED
ncbi:MAG: hypothetical protein J5641_03690 [Bacteroidales bacterium]|nr:hypothetical protein [Bacteroidales bacterium]